MPTHTLSEIKWSKTISTASIATIPKKTRTAIVRLNDFIRAMSLNVQPQPAEAGPAMEQ